jgi:hypothetical protein
MFEILIIMSLFVVTEIVTGSKAFKVAEKVPKWDRDCKNNCGAHGYRWGSLGGYCGNCKHSANVGCKCILNGCGKIYWAKTMAEKKLANARGRA